LEKEVSFVFKGDSNGALRIVPEKVYLVLRLENPEVDDRFDLIFRNSDLRHILAVVGLLERHGFTSLFEVRVAESHFALSHFLRMPLCGVV